MSAKFDLGELQCLLECGICLSRLLNPRVLPCLHFYCMECLESHIMLTKNTRGEFRCQQCQETHVVPAHGAEGFPKNIFASTLNGIMWASSLKQNSMTEQINGTPVEDNTSGQRDPSAELCGKSDIKSCKSFSDNDICVLLEEGKMHQSEEEGNAKRVNNSSSDCRFHRDQKVKWYCNTCILPACADCMLEDHKTHDTEKLYAAAELFKDDLLYVMILATKRIDFLDKVSTNMNASRIEMKEELDEAIKAVSHAAGGMCELTRQQQSLLLDKLKRAGEAADMQFTKSEEVVDRAKQDMGILKSCAETFYKASSDYAHCMVQQASVNKQQFLHQHEIPVPSVDWNFTQIFTGSAKPHQPGLLGHVDVSTSDETKLPKPEPIFLEAPIRTTKLDYATRWAICGIAPVHRDVILVTYSTVGYIYAYNDIGKLTKQLDIPGIDAVFNMVLIDGKQGKVAIVDGSQSRVHFVTLSKTLAVLQHHSTDVPMVASRINISGQKELLVNNWKYTNIVSLNTDGQILSNLNVTIPHAKFAIECVAQTKSGFVICDSENKQVYFTDANGDILHTSIDCVEPMHAVPTSWGHVLVADERTYDIKVFSHVGAFLGCIQEKNNPFTYPYCIHVDEAEKRLFIGCGPVGKYEVRVYKFSPGSLLPQPVTQTLTTLTVNLQLVTI